jgi:hypothetical protein
LYPGFSPDEKKQFLINMQNEVILSSFFAEYKQSLLRDIDEFERSVHSGKRNGTEAEIATGHLQARIHIYDLLEILFLNQVRLRELLEEMTNALLLPNSQEKLKALRKKFEEMVQKAEE